MLDSSPWSDRGGRWVLAQAALMALTLLAGVLPPGWPDAVGELLAALGAVLALLGAVVAVWAWRMLGERKAASPFPRPREGGRLVEGGPYAYVRHPIYAAGLLFFTGFAFATSPTALIPLVALAFFWHAKARLEEQYLETHYQDYREYRERVPGLFVPKLGAD